MNHCRFTCVANVTLIINVSIESVHFSSRELYPKM